MFLICYKFIRFATNKHNVLTSLKSFITNLYNFLSVIDQPPKEVGFFLVLFLSVYNLICVVCISHDIV